MYCSSALDKDAGPAEKRTVVIASNCLVVVAYSVLGQGVWPVGPEDTLVGRSSVAVKIASLKETHDQSRALEKRVATYVSNN